MCVTHRLFVLLAALYLLSQGVSAGPEAPSNDDCIDAVPILSGAVALGTTLGATTDAGFPPIDSMPLDVPAVWFVYEHTSLDAERVSATLCLPQNAGVGFSAVYVYEDLCADEPCSPCQYVAPVGVNMGPPDEPCADPALAGVTFCARPDARYVIAISADPPGPVSLEIVSLGLCPLEESLDTDQDRTPDALDLNPVVYDPCQFLEASFPIVELAQISFWNDGVPLLEHSDHGIISMTLPNRESDIAYLSVEINSQPAITNMPVWGVEHHSVLPMHTVSAHLPIGPRGVLVTDVEVRYCLTDVPVPSVPAIAPTFTMPVQPIHYQRGGAVAEGLVATPVAPGPIGPQVFLEARTDETRANPQDVPILAQIGPVRPNFKAIDLDDDNEENACGPASCANSFYWLREFYGITIPDSEKPGDATNPPTPEQVLQRLLDKLREDMQSDPSTGRTKFGDPNRMDPANGGFVNGKEAFAKRNGMPVTIGGAGKTSSNPGAPIVLDDLLGRSGLLNAIRRGSDVELFVEWEEGGMTTGHWMNLVDIYPVFNDDGTILHYVAVVVDDTDQGNLGGTKRRTVKIQRQNPSDPNSPWTFTEGQPGTVYTIRGYTTEEPSYKAVVDEAKRVRDAFQAKLADANANGVTPENAVELKRLAEKYLDLVGVMTAKTFDVDPNDLIPVDSVNAMNQLFRESLEMLGAAQSLCTKAESGGRSVELICPIVPGEDLPTLLGQLDARFNNVSATLDALEAVLDLCAADFDLDGDVDLGNFGVFGAAFNSVSGDVNYIPTADFDNDGDVDLGDFGVFGSEFNRTDCLP